MNKVKVLKNIKLDKNIAMLDTDACYFSISDLNSKYVPSIKTSIFEKIRETGKQLSTIAEDFLIVALSVYAIDKRFSRSNSLDAWTRNFKVEIPVIEIDKWNGVIPQLQSMLNFLSGDVWLINFVKTEERICMLPQNEIIQKVDTDFDVVSLFSGGLDSFCGAIKFLSDNEKVLFVGNEEYPKLQIRQKELVNILKEEYSTISFGLATFTANAHSYILNGESKENKENTSRTRSLLFIAAGICFASMMDKKNIQVYIPENGFIGLNLPLTPSRMGSCSTRTTHPRFLKDLNAILQTIGIDNQVINPFRTCAKSEMVKLVEGTNAFKRGAGLTISCSHPTQPKWQRKKYPKNCGYCYPCLIRLSSLAHLKIGEEYSYDFNKDFDELEGDKQSDLNALLNALYMYKKYGREHIVKAIRNVGGIELPDVNKFADLYEQTLKDFETLISSDKIKEIIGEK